MTILDDLELVVRLACETESRTPAEQLALLRTAAKIDDERNACVVGNGRMYEQAGSTDAVRIRPLSRLADYVRATRRVDEDDPEDRHVDLPTKQLDAIARRFERWEAIPAVEGSDPVPLDAAARAWLDRFAGLLPQGVDRG